MFLKILVLVCLLGSVLSANPTGTLVQITNSLGHKLYAGVFQPPASFVRPRPAVVIAHGSGGVYSTTNGVPTSMDNEYAEWANLLTSAGYVALFVDSYNPISGRPVGKKWANSAYIRPHDLYAGKQYLNTLSTVVRSQEVYLLGISHGSTAVLTALKNTNVAANLKFKSGVGYYACCGCGECGVDPYTCADGKCANCPQCPICECTASTYCPYAPLLIFAAETDPGCKSGYSESYIPNSVWGKNWCDDRIKKAVQQGSSCPIAAAKKFKMLTYTGTGHGFDYLPPNNTFPNNGCAKTHSRQQTLNWFQQGVISTASACFGELYEG